MVAALLMPNCRDGRQSRFRLAELGSSASPRVALFINSEKVKN